MSRPNVDSLSSVRSKPLHSLISDLFDFSEKQEEFEWCPSKRYKMIPEFFESYDDEEFQEVLNILQETAHKSMNGFRLHNWVVDVSLRENNALKYFVHHCKNVYLWVDEQKRVTLIELDIGIT
ncbi:hypothetical protein [Solibacillus cecembensis]|uniref:hypothetical protein n=1 Tax=Solibacillus cecembensis TaxID=459347 RepID=UPI003D065738